MNITETRAREERRTQPAPVSLEHGRFEPEHVVQLFGIAATALGAGSFGGLLLTWGAAGSASEWGWVAGLATWVGVFGGLMMALGFALAGAVTLLAARGWWRHQLRVDDWHYAQLDAYEAAGGQELRREVLQRSLVTTEPLHAIAVALHVIDRHRAGEATPWSVPKLTGPVWYGNVRLGDLTKGEAEEFSRLLAEVGIVGGRRKGSAGQLAASTEGEVLQLVAKNWGKWVPGRVDREGE